jgi:hypothetical protein
MLDSKLVFLYVLRRRIANLFVSLNLDDENAVTLLDEEVGAEFAALWMFAFLLGILNGVEADWRILQPSVYDFRVVLSHILRWDSQTVVVILVFRFRLTDRYFFL